MIYLDIDSKLDIVPKHGAFDAALVPQGSILPNHTCRSDGGLVPKGGAGGDDVVILRDFKTGEVKGQPGVSNLSNRQGQNAVITDNADQRMPKMVP